MIARLAQLGLHSTDMVAAANIPTLIFALPGARHRQPAIVVGGTPTLPHSPATRGIHPRHLDALLRPRPQRKTRAMRAKIRGTEIYFDIEGMGLVPDGGAHARKAGRLRHPWRAGRRPYRLQARHEPARRADAAGLFRPPRPGALRQGRPGALHARRECRGHGGAARASRASARSSPSARAMAAWSRWRMRRAIPNSVSHLILVVTAAHPGSMRAPARSSPSGARRSRRRCATQLWAGELDTAEKLRHYYEVMGPMYWAPSSTRPRPKGARRGTLDARMRSTAPLPRAASCSLMICGRNWAGSPRRR